jgi:hypothetical protein
LIIDLHTIPKLSVVHDQFQLVEPLDPLPAFLGGLEQFEPIDNVVSRWPQDRLRLVLSLTVANVDSIGLVVRK